jgi:hypothetical protein
MPPRIGTNIMMVMREGIVHTMRASLHQHLSSIVLRSSNYIHFLF